MVRNAAANSAIVLEIYYQKSLDQNVRGDMMLELIIGIFIPVKPMPDEKMLIRSFKRQLKKYDIGYRIGVTDTNVYFYNSLAEFKAAVTEVVEVAEFYRIGKELSFGTAHAWILMLDEDGMVPLVEEDNDDILTIIKDWLEACQKRPWALEGLFPAP